MKQLKDEETYIPERPLDILNNFVPIDSSKEVIYTFGTEEIVKDNGKYYLSSTIFPDKAKEISREMATEIWQSCNMKTRDDVSVNFDKIGFRF